MKNDINILTLALAKKYTDEHSGGGSMFCGNIDQTTTSFPTTRPDGTALNNGDYVKVSLNAILPFTIDGIEFKSTKDQATYLGDEWVLNASAFQNTEETPVKNKTIESYTETATKQSQINQEVAEYIKNYKAVIGVTTLPTTDIKQDVLYNLKEQDGAYEVGVYYYTGTDWVMLPRGYNPDEETITLNVDKELEVKDEAITDEKVNPLLKSTEIPEDVADAVDTKLTTEKAVKTELDKKVDKEQGVANANKYLKVDEDGFVFPEIVSTVDVKVDDSTVESLDGTSTTQNEVNEELVEAIRLMKLKVDVVDIVSCYDRETDTTKTDIVHYDLTTLVENDIIKVLKDETHSNQLSYFKYNGTTFDYIGSEQNADVDDITIDRNASNQLEVKDEGITDAKINPLLKSTEIPEDIVDAVDTKLTTEKAVKTELDKKVDIAQGTANKGKILKVNDEGNLELVEIVDKECYRGNISAVSDLPNDIKKGQIFRALNDITFTYTATDLTGLTWTGNNTIDIGSSIEGNHAINFIAESGQVFDNMNFNVGYQQLKYTIDDLGYVAYTGSSWNTGRRTITFTGGSAATETVLINWLNTNGTLILPDDVIVPAGACIVSEKDNPAPFVDGINWTILYTNESPDYSTVILDYKDGETEFYTADEAKTILTKPNDVVIMSKASDTLDTSIAFRYISENFSHGTHHLYFICNPIGSRSWLMTIDLQGDIGDEEINHVGSSIEAQRVPDVDNSTIEYTTSGKIRVKNEGITYNKLNPDSVDNTDLTDNNYKIPTSQVVKTNLDKKLTQYSTMPIASVDYQNKVVQYIGVDTTDYINGHIYKCVEEDSTYIWKEIVFGNNGMEYTEVPSLESLQFTSKAAGVGTVYYTSCIAYGNGIYMYVVNSSNIYYAVVSTNGQTWTKYLITDESYYTAADQVTLKFTNGKFYLVDNFADPASKGAWESTDGQTWTCITQNSPAIDDAIAISSIAFNDDKSIGIITCNFEQYFAKSVDGGQTWSLVPFTKDSDGVSQSPIMYGNGIFVLGDTHKLYYSMDGNSFTQATVPNPPTGNEYFTEIKFINGKFFAMSIGLNRIWISTDGINWQVITVQGDTWGDILWVGNQYLLLHVSDDNHTASNKKAATSEDGINWKIIDSNQAYLKCCCTDDLIVGVPSGIRGSNIYTAPTISGVKGVITQETEDITEDTANAIKRYLPSMGVSGVKGEAESSYRTGDVDITKANIGLGNVVDTGDSATPTSGGNKKFTTGGAYTELAKKSNRTNAFSNKTREQLLTGLGTSSQGDYYLGTINFTNAESPEGSYLIFFSFELHIRNIHNVILIACSHDSGKQYICRKVDGVWGNWAEIALSADKQDKTDNSLITTDKTVVGAINELASLSQITGLTFHSCVMSGSSITGYRIGKFIYIFFNAKISYSGAQQYIKLVNNIPKIKAEESFTAVLSDGTNILKIAADGRTSQGYTTCIRTESYTTIPQGWYYGFIAYIAD